VAETAHKKLAFQNDPRGWINCRDKPFSNVCVVVYALRVPFVNVKTGRTTWPGTRYAKHKHGRDAGRQAGKMQ
jgi:hypothetical protein